MPDSELRPERSDFYVYVLFDWRGIPRYVGKGRGHRWLQHEKRDDPNNNAKSLFIRETLDRLGSVPKIKVREGLAETQAFETEAALIAVLGREPFGPLTNLTDKRNGPTSERMRAWHAARSPEERSATVRRGKANMDSERLSEIGRANALKAGRETLSERMRAARAAQSKEERTRIASEAGKASAAAAAPEERRARGDRLQRVLAELSPEDRHDLYLRSGIGKASKEQLSEWGKRSGTLEELSERGRKGAAAAHGARTPEERKALAYKASMAALEAKKRRLDSGPK